LKKIVFFAIIELVNKLIKFSGEFFTAKDSLSERGQFFVENLRKNDIERGYIVVGGGNRLRGKQSMHDRNASDNIGILSTLMNGFILQEHLRKLGLNSVVFSHFDGFGETYTPQKAIDSFNLGNFVILTTGLGRVGFVSTDLSSVIKSLELKVDSMVKVTKFNGVFDCDPESFPQAKVFSEISYEKILEEKIPILDLAATAIAYENRLKLHICDENGFFEQNSGTVVI
jgi:uridylate kinase